MNMYYNEDTNEVEKTELLIVLENEKKALSKVYDICRKVYLLDDNIGDNYFFKKAFKRVLNVREYDNASILLDKIIDIIKNDKKDEVFKDIHKNEINEIFEGLKDIFDCPHNRYKLRESLNKKRESELRESLNQAIDKFMYYLK